MVSDKAFAKEVVQLVLDCAGRLDETGLRAKEVLSETEFLAYRKAIGEVLGAAWDELPMPIYASHPDLKPKDLQ